MQVEIIKSYDAFCALEANWNALYLEDPEALFFLSWPWLSGVFKENPDKWRVLAVKPDGNGADYVGFFPITVKTVWSKSRHQFRNEVHMAGTLFWGQYTGFICHPRWEEQVLSSLADQLKKMHWSRLSLKYFYASDRRLALFTDQFPDSLFRTSHHKRLINDGVTNNLVCPCIDLPDDYDTYLQTQLSSNTRQKIRRFTRKFENSEDLRITRTSSKTLETDLDILIGFWMQRWKESKGRKTKYLARKYRQILRNGFERGALHMPLLWRGDTPLGAHANLIDWQKPALYFFCFRSRPIARRTVDWLGPARTRYALGY